MRGAGVAALLGWWEGWSVEAIPQGPSQVLGGSSAEFGAAWKIIAFTATVSWNLSPACKEVVGRRAVDYKCFFICVPSELLCSVLL